MVREPKVLLIERGSTHAPSFAPALRKKGFRVETRRSVPEGLSSLKQYRPDIVVLDAASMKTSGVRMARQITARTNGVPLILVSPQGTLPNQNDSASVVLVHPFTPRKLINRIRRFLPTNGRDELRAGPISLDSARQVVCCEERQTRLTPKASEMLKLLIERRGQLVRRDELMRKIWHTDYTGDTRTIDVHISWLRKALEADPRFPRFLKTIRGLGYRLDLPED